MKTKIILFVFHCFVFFSCQKSPDKQQIMTEEAMQHQNDFKDISLDNSVDFICNMELSIGISDTSHFDGKIYGFCSKICKAEFKNNPQKFILKD
jgi:YHS domain-containing protein